MNVTTPATNSRTGFAFGQIEQKSPLAGAAAALTEAVIVPPPAAIANAIYNAVGVHMDVLPMSPANILTALWKKQKEFNGA